MGSPSIVTTPPRPHEPQRAAHRLLIPIDATEGSRRGLHHALDLARRGEAVEACLLYIVAPARDWEVLRFRTEQEIHQHFQQRSEVFLAEASAPLGAAGIPCRTYFREQEPVFGILDLAEQLDCTGIVMPRPDWLDFHASGMVRRLRHARRAIPVILIDADGAVEP